MFLMCDGVIERHPDFAKWLGEFPRSRFGLVGVFAFVSLNARR